MNTEELPLGWAITKLTDIGALYCGQSPSVSEVNGDGNGTAYITGPESWNGASLHVEKWTTNPKRTVPNGCVFITVKGAGVGKLFRGIPCAIGRDIYAYKPFDEVSSDFIRYSLQANINSVLTKAKGDIPGLSKSHILGHYLMLPPFAEQRRIVARIEELFAELDEAVAELERVRANLKRYRASVLKAAVSGDLTADWRATRPTLEPASVLLERILRDRRTKWEADQLAKFAAANKPPPKNWQAKYAEPSPPDTSTLPPLPEGWCWATVEQCAIETTVGHVGPMKSQYMPTGVPFLRSQNVRPFRFDREGLKYIPSEFHLLLRKSRLEGGELLIVRSGNIGEACVYPTDAGEANCSDLVITRFASGMLAEFAMFYVNSPVGKRFVAGQQTGSALSHFNVGAMEHSPIPLPPFAEQEAIVAEVEARLSDVTAAEAIVSANLTRAARLRQSILRDAFAGRLVPQDPADEPASVLLDRIRVAKSNTAKPTLARKSKASPSG